MGDPAEDVGLQRWLRQQAEEDLRVEIARTQRLKAELLMRSGVDIDRLEALLAAASPGPWRSVKADSTDGPLPWSTVSGPDNNEPYVCESMHHNADLIAELRNAAPALLAELRLLRASK